MRFAAVLLFLIFQSGSAYSKILTSRDDHGDFLRYVFYFTDEVIIEPTSIGSNLRLLGDGLSYDEFSGLVSELGLSEYIVISRDGEALSLTEVCDCIEKIGSSIDSSFHFDLIEGPAGNQFFNNADLGEGVAINSIQEIETYPSIFHSDVDNSRINLSNSRTLYALGLAPFDLSSSSQSNGQEFDENLDENIKSALYPGLHSVRRLESAPVIEVENFLFDAIRTAPAAGNCFPSHVVEFFSRLGSRDGMHSEADLNNSGNINIGDEDYTSEFYKYIELGFLPEAEFYLNLVGLETVRAELLDVLQVVKGGSFSRLSDTFIACDEYSKFWKIISSEEVIVVDDHFINFLTYVKGFSVGLKSYVLPRVLKRIEPSGVSSSKTILGTDYDRFYPSDMSLAISEAIESGVDNNFDKFFSVNPSVGDSYERRLASDALAKSVSDTAIEKDIRYGLFRRELEEENWFGALQELRGILGIGNVPFNDTVEVVDSYFSNFVESASLGDFLVLTQEPDYSELSELLSPSLRGFIDARIKEYYDSFDEDNSSVNFKPEQIDEGESAGVGRVDSLLAVESTLDYWSSLVSSSVQLREQADRVISGMSN